MKHIYRKLMMPVGVILLAPFISAGDPTIDATCSVKTTWSEPLVSIPVEWLDELTADTLVRIEAFGAPDTVAAKMMLIAIRVNIQAALEETNLTSANKKALNEMLVVVNQAINSNGEQLLDKFVIVAKDGTTALTTDITTKLAGLVSAEGDAFGSTFGVTGRYSWCEGHFDSGQWNILDLNTNVSGAGIVSVNSTGKGELSTAVGVALGAHASVEAPATVKVRAAVTAAVIGERVTPVVAVKNKYTFQPAYSMSFKCTVNIEAGWGLNLGSGSTFTYLVPSADAAVNSIVLAPQTLTIEENDPNVICVQPAR